MVGKELGNYQLLRLIGAGGMGEVYLAQHKRLARKAAVKVLHGALAAQPGLLDRFFAEARAASSIRHPGIVEVLDCDVEDGTAYIVLELLEGESLAASLRRTGPMGTSLLRVALTIARQVADAVGAAHRAGIVHRDLKPDNVYLTLGAQGEVRVKILDFGIAKLLGERAQGASLTRTGSVLGTPLYMSPEQCRGLSTIDHRTDIYSLGCVLFEMLTGRPPFASENPGDLLVDHITRPPPKLTSFDATLPAALDSLIARLSAKAPEERPGSMLDVAAELEALERISRVAALAPTMALPAAVPTPVPPPTPVAEGVASSASSWAVARSHVRGPDGRGAPTTPRRRWLTVPGVLVAIGGLVLVGALVALRGGQHAASPENARSGGAPPSTAPVAAPTVATPPAPPPSVAPPVAPHPKPEPPTAVAPESQGGSTAKANEAPAPSPAKKGRSPRTTPKSASEKATTRDAILDL